MPRSVVLFERLAYLALILGTASVILNYPVTIRLPGVTTAFVVATQAASMALQAVLIWLIARKRKNWARWIWLVLIGAGTIIAAALQVVHPSPQNGITGTTAFLLVYVVSLLSAACLLKQDARDWFGQADPA